MKAFFAVMEKRVGDRWLPGQFVPGGLFRRLFGVNEPATYDLESIVEYKDAHPRILVKLFMGEYPDVLEVSPTRGVPENASDYTKAEFASVKDADEAGWISLDEIESIDWDNAKKVFMEMGVSESYTVRLSNHARKVARDLRRIGRKPTRLVFWSCEQ